MAPVLQRGDWLIVDAATYRRRSPRVGDVVVVRDPRGAGRVLVKRVRAVSQDGRVDVRGDDADASTDSRSFGPVPTALVVGRVVLRYWPPARAGRVA
jgi:nickel-type superoxide dismutase maturation protease